MNNHTDALLESVYSVNIARILPTNRTTLSVAPSSNKLTAGFISLFAVISIFFNGLLLAAFIKRPSLRTPFNCYIINLAIVDALSALFPMPLNILRQMLQLWPFDGLTCTFFLYISQMCNASNRAAHLLIAVNRLWAVTFPVSYRNRHTKRLAVGLVVFTWLLILCLVTPEVIIGRKNFNHSLFVRDPKCGYDANANQVYHLIFNAAVFNMPEVVILIGYLWLVFKLRQRIPNRVRISPVKPSPHGTLDSNVSSQLSSKADIRLSGLNNREDSQNSQETAEENMRNRSSRPVIPGNRPAKRHQTSSRARGHNRLFAYLVLPVICCWTPNHVYYLWAGSTGSWNVALFTMQFFLTYANSWLNPLLIYLADSQIRQAVNAMIKCR